MRTLATSYETIRSCNHREPDRSLAGCHEWVVSVKAGCETNSGTIQLASLWMEEDGQRYTWWQLSDEQKQEAFGALDEENCRVLTDAASQVVLQAVGK